MKLHTLGTNQGRRITAYGSGYIILDETRIEQNVIILPTQLITDWLPAENTQIGAALLAIFDANANAADVVIFGTGSAHRPLPAELVCQFNARGIGIEAMTSPSAYGTYNMLIAEDRKVAAALLVTL